VLHIRNSYTREVITNFGYEGGVGLQALIVRDNVQIPFPRGKIQRNHLHAQDVDSMQVTLHLKAIVIQIRCFETCSTQTQTQTQTHTP
jgi:hypothetical protein